MSDSSDGGNLIVDGTSMLSPRLTVVRFVSSDQFTSPQDEWLMLSDLSDGGNLIVDGTFLFHPRSMDVRLVRSARFRFSQTISPHAEPERSSDVTVCGNTISDGIDWASFMRIGLDGLDWTWIERSRFRVRLIVV